MSKVMIDVINGQPITVDSVVIRIDGNKDYEYAKTSATVVDGAIYIIDDTSLQLLNDGFVLSEILKGRSDNYISLLNLVIRNYKGIRRAIELVKKNGETIKNINWIDGFSVSID